MSSEIRLLAEVLRCVPSESVWRISSDSWEGIKTAFGALLFHEIGTGNWRVRITDENRDAVIQKANEEEVAEKAIHMNIESDDQTTLFQSYDAMCGIFISKKLYNDLNPDNIPADLEIGLG